MERRIIMGGSDFAARRNAANTAKAVEKLDRMLRNASLSEPRMGFKDLVRRTKATLERLGQRTEQAREIMGHVEQKRREGRLADEALVAETLAPCLVVAFHESFTEMFGLAERDEDAYSLQRVNIAASVLLGQIDSSNLMAEGNYPKSEQQVSDALVESKILRAKAAWLDVYQALDSVHEKLNVQIPFLDKA
jgi:hypothetical protein